MTSNSRPFQNHPALGALSALLQEESAGQRELEDMLVQENQVLQNPDTDALYGISQRKNQLLQQLGVAHAKRQRLLQQLGSHVPGSPAFFNRFPGLSDNEKMTITQHWEMLLDRSRRLQQKNQENGLLIELRLQLVQGALKALFGDVAMNAVYSPHGQSKALQARRSLGKA